MAPALPHGHHDSRARAGHQSLPEMSPYRYSFIREEGQPGDASPMQVVLPPVGNVPAQPISKRARPRAHGGQTAEAQLDHSRLRRVAASGRCATMPFGMAITSVNPATGETIKTYSEM